MYIRHSHPFHSLHHMNDDDDDDMIVIIKLSLKQDTLPIVSCDRAVLVNSTQRGAGGGRGKTGRGGKARESVVHVVIYEKRRSFSASPLRFWDPNDELNRLVPR